MATALERRMQEIGMLMDQPETFREVLAYLRKLETDRKCLVEALEDALDTIQVLMDCDASSESGIAEHHAAKEAIVENRNLLRDLGELS